MLWGYIWGYISKNGQQTAPDKTFRDLSPYQIEICATTRIQE
jgi:hypothetical protein